MLYTRECDLCKKKIVSLFAPDSEFTIYCPDCWWSDKWDPMQYGRDFDFNRGFFEQYAELLKETPLIALWLLDCENADYNNACYNLKNGYLNVAADKSEDAYYNYISCEIKNSADCTATWESELCYSCIDCEKLYNCIYCQRCRQSQNCLFCSDCIGCEHCIGCHGMRHKKYCLFNQQLSKEEWESKVGDLVLTPQIIEEMKRRSDETRLKVPQVYAVLNDCESCTGNYLWHCKNSTDCFDCQKAEDCRRVVYSPFDLKDTYDCYAIGGIELGYEVLGGGVDTYNVQFINHLYSDLNSVQYSSYCGNGSENLFGCVSLKRKKYCIFNKQYSEEEYKTLRSKIIEHMKHHEEWGEFFPPQYSPFGYNETVAQEYFPLNKTQAIEQGFRWHEENVKNYIPQTVQIAGNINVVPDTVLQETLACQDCKKNYKIIAQELEFYRNMKLPIPTKCPDCRHFERLQLRNPRKLWSRTCQKCGQEVQTTYAPERPEKVYCEECYLQEVY